MFNKNNISFGIATGCLLPAIMWVVCDLVLHNDGAVRNRPGVLYLVAVGLNLIILRYFMRRELDRTARGIMLSTFTFMVLVFLFKINLPR